MRNRRLYSRVASLIFVCCGFFSPAVGQNVADWSLQAPTQSVRLISVGRNQPVLGMVCFTLENVSSEPILELLVAVSNGRGDQQMTGIDRFSSGARAIKPGEKIRATFAESIFDPPTAMTKELRIAAIVYADGSRFGSKDTLDKIEDQMLGAALEIKRDFDILASSPDQTAGGLDGVAEQIGMTLPTTDQEAAESVNEIQLPGVPQSYIDTRLKRQDGGILAGVRTARQFLLGEIHNKKTQANFQTGSLPSAAQETQAGAVLDLSQKYQAVSEEQSRWIAAFVQNQPPE
jgi:hypothetical protein